MGNLLFYTLKRVLLILLREISLTEEDEILDIRIFLKQNLVFFEYFSMYDFLLVNPRMKKSTFNEPRSM